VKLELVYHEEFVPSDIEKRNIRVMMLLTAAGKREMALISTPGA
jgi:hypothetical protein